MKTLTPNKLQDYLCDNLHQVSTYFVDKYRNKESVLMNLEFNHVAANLVNRDKADLLAWAGRNIDIIDGAAMEYGQKSSFLDNIRQGQTFKFIKQLESDFTEILQNLTIYYIIDNGIEITESQLHELFYNISDKYDFDEIVVEIEELKEA